MSTYTVPANVTHVTSTLIENGYEAYLVGGCVRDLLLNKKPKDWDITTSAHPEEIQKLFTDTYYNNVYGTVGVVFEDAADESTKVIEVTPYRADGTYSDARRPDSVSFGVSLTEDLDRRDLTVNAIALDVHKGHVVDPHKGHEDLLNGLLRAVGDADARYREDALRMLRTIRLAAELGFAIEQRTFEAIAENAPLLGNISKERIRDEFTKMVMSKYPMEAMVHMKQTGTLHYVVPDLERSIGVEQNQAHSYTVFEHSLRALQHAADKSFPLHVRLAALFHDISKPESRRKGASGDWTFSGHEVIGSRVTKKALQQLRFPADIVEKVVKLVRWHMFFSDPEKVTLSAVRRMVSNVGEDNIWSLIDVRICDRIGTGRPKEQPFRLRRYKAMIDEALRSPIAVSMLAIDGKAIMDVTHETAGPRIGNILHALLEEVLDDPAKNTAAYLQRRATELSGLGDSELAELGSRGRRRKEDEDELEVQELRKKHNVS